MHTPSLRRRVTATSAAVLVVLLLAMDAFLYLTLRAHLEDTLTQVLDTRIGIALRLSTEVPAPDLASALTEVGVPATVRGSDGRQFSDSPAVPHIGQYTPPTVVFAPRVERTASLTGGGTVTVYASRAGVNQTLRRLLVLELLGTAVAVGLAVLLLAARPSRTALVLLAYALVTSISDPVLLYPACLTVLLVLLGHLLPEHAGAPLDPRPSSTAAPRGSDARTAAPIDSRRPQGAPA